ncbi:MAG: hypothetical protein RLZZ546_1849 [Bacteroidota bacterium]
MNINEEIQELEDMLSENPDNSRLRKMIIKKMYESKGYWEQMEEHIKYILKSENDIILSNLLLEVFYKNGKISPCIVLGDQLHSENNMTAASMVTLSKAYLKEGNISRAQLLYEEALLLDKNINDIELNQALRLSEASEDVLSGFNPFMEKPSMKFADVGGLEIVKREIDLKSIKPLQFPDLYKSYGKKIGGGILLYGPPGCGKTYLAKATAGEINAGFINVTLNDILDMWIGNSEKNLNKIFSTARSNKPSVLFFDEIDALGAKRSDMKQSGGKNVINQFLSELDGVETSNDGVLIIGATNVPWHLDAAFRRPGRFDRIVFIPPPDLDGREAIMKILLKGKPVDNIDYNIIAKSTPFFSGADLNSIIDVSIEKIIEEAIHTGTQKKIETKDLLNAIKERRPSTLEWFNTAKNYATFSNVSGQYDDILKYIKENKL